MRALGVGVVRDDVGEESLRVPVDLRVLPGGRAQHHQQRGGGGPHARLRRQFLRAPRNGPDQHRQHADAGEVLKAVGDHRKSHIAVVHETEHRADGDHKKQHAGQWPPSDASAQQPQGCQQRRPGCGMYALSGADIVDDRQIRRPHQLADIKPQRAGRHQDAVLQRERGDNGFDRSRQPQVGHGDAESQRKERQSRPQLASGHPPALPPVPDQQRRG